MRLKLFEDFDREGMENENQGGDIQATLNECIDKCQACVDEYSDNEEMSECVQKCKDCVDVCNTMLSLLENDSELCSQMAEVCKTACDMCAEVCESHENETCQACAEACKACAEGCDDLCGDDRDEMPEEEMPEEMPEEELNEEFFGGKKARKRDLEKDYNLKSSVWTKKGIIEEPTREDYLEFFHAAEEDNYQGKVGHKDGKIFYRPSDSIKWGSAGGHVFGSGE